MIYETITIQVMQTSIWISSYLKDEVCCETPVIRRQIMNRKIPHALAIPRRWNKQWQASTAYNQLLADATILTIVAMFPVRPGRETETGNEDRSSENLGNVAGIHLEYVRFDERDAIPIVRKRWTRKDGDCSVSPGRFIAPFRWRICVRGLSPFLR